MRFDSGNSSARGHSFGPGRFSVVLLALVGSLGAASVAGAHASGENYVWLNVDDSRLRGHFEIRLSDLRDVLGLEIPEDYEAAQARVLETEETVRAYILQNFRLFAGRGAGAGPGSGSGGGAGSEPIAIEFTGTDLMRAPDFGHFARYAYQTRELAPVPDRVRVENTLIFGAGRDRLHRSLLCIAYNVKTGMGDAASFDPAQGEPEEFVIAQVFGPGSSDKWLDLTSDAGLIPVRAFVWEGVRHLWLGLDHILFLVALLLPAVLQRSGVAGAWEPVPVFRRAFFNVLKIVTVFTVAHSVTLSLAALGLVEVPSGLVEPLIALSIVIVALNNIRPIFRDAVWPVIFLFGLFHGLGFASVMGDLPFRMVNLIEVLFAFNVGIELGQVAIVALLFPLLSFSRTSPHYQKFVLMGGSAAIAVISSVWLVQRTLHL